MKKSEIAWRRSQGRRRITDVAIVSLALGKALRTGRISRDVAPRCTASWSHRLAARPTWLKWSLVAITDLAYAGRLRRGGNLGLARVALNEARQSRIRSEQLQAQAT